MRVDFRIFSALVGNFEVVAMVLAAAMSCPSLVAGERS